MASGNTRRRARRNTQPVAPTPQAPREPSNPNWTVVTSNPGVSTPSLSHQSLSSSSPGHGYLSHHHPRLPDRYQLPPPMPGPSSSVAFQEQALSPGVRYSPYASHSAPIKPPPTNSLSLEIPSSRQESERITLAPLRAPPLDPGSNNSAYALPPISALEDLRGIHNNDSAAVLRRLQSDDDPPAYSRSHSRAASQDDNEKAWMRRHSLTSHPYS